MRFLIDMGIAASTASQLRNDGHDAIHLLDESLQTLSDMDILAKARSEKRIILTHDLDFSRLLAIQGCSGPSVITFRLSDMRPRNVYLHLMEALKAFAKELETGAVISIGDRTARCHTLPMVPQQ